jgi:anti-anti-sigma factor
VARLATQFPTGQEEDQMHTRTSTAAALPRSTCQPGTIKEIAVTDTITALDLEGEIDIALSPQLIEHAQRVLTSSKHLIINLSDTTFIDSSVIHALFTSDTAAQNADRAFVVQLATAATVERVITITTADKKLTVAHNRNDAVNLIHQQAAPS